MIELNTIIFYVIPYLMFFALLWLSKEKKGIRLFDENGFVSNRRILIVLHVGGIILFGMFPLLTGHFSSEVNLNRDYYIGVPVGISVFFTLVFIIFAFWQAKKKFSILAQKATLNQVPGIGYLAAYFPLRIIFICVYENWFRHYLLNDCIYSFGIPVAIAINVCLYTLLHSVNGREEVVACIPFGLLLCILCILQNAIWPAIAIHLALTITYETSFLKQMVTHKRAAI